LLPMLERVAKAEGLERSPSRLNRGKFVDSQAVENLRISSHKMCCWRA
jgi:hypothetical protein